MFNFGNPTSAGKDILKNDNYLRSFQWIAYWDEMGSTSPIHNSNVSFHSDIP
jgi:hypothetical protein